MIAPCPNSRVARSSRSFALVITLVMVAVLAIIAVGVFTSASLERVTSKSYDNRYQAELAVQNGLEAFKETLVATPFPSPAPSPLPSSVTNSDTFLVVTAANGSATYYYLAEPSAGSSPTISYYPLFSSSTNPSAPAIQTQTISLTAQDAPNPQNLTKPFAPSVPAPSPPADSTASDSTSAWNAAKTQRMPALYSWAQPSPSPSGPSVKWVEMRDPQDTATAPAHNLPYTRYAYWAEDLDGYLDASQVGGQARTSGTSPQEIAMWTVFNSTPQTDPGTTAATTLINQRPLLFTVPTVQQIAATTPDLAGPNLAVRLGMDNSPGEQNLVSLGYGYTGEGQAKTNLNALISQVIQGQGGGIADPIKNALSAALPAFANRSSGNGTFNYLSNLAVNIADYASPQSAPTDFNPPGNPFNPSNSYRGIGAYPFVVSLYDLNNWVYTYLSSSKKSPTYHVVIEVRTYVQLWNPHNVPVPDTVGGTGTLTVQYQNSDQVSYNGNSFPLTSPADAKITFANGATSDPNQPVITSTLNKTGRVNQSFSYQITATVGTCAPIPPNSYLVVVLPQPTVSGYGATGLPPGLTVSSGGVISGKPTTTGTFNVTINSTSSSGTTGSATLVITINP